MPTSKTPIQLAANASKLHKRVLELLTESPLYQNYEIRQEYRVSDINPEFKSNREKIDIVIKTLRVAIEIMGEQHEGPVCFGGIEECEAKQNYRRIINRDSKKRQAVLDAGWAYVVINYTEKSLSPEDLNAYIRQAIVEVQVAKTKKVIAEKLNKIAVAKAKKPKLKYNWPKGRKIAGRKFNGDPIK